MLSRTLKQNLGGLHNAAKQILIWAVNKKADFCTLPEEGEFFHVKKNRYPYRRDNFGYDEFPYDTRRFERRKFDNGYRYGGSKFPGQRRSGFQLRTEDVQFKSDLTEIVKNFYKPHPDVLNRSEEEIKEFRRKNDITIFGKNTDCLNPIFNFSELNLPSGAMSVIQELKLSTPTPVQSQTWPLALSGNDMVGISQTGSGKTLGFVLPALIHIKNQHQRKGVEGPIVLIIAPTRELVQQISKVILPFMKCLSLKLSLLHGGTSKSFQAERIISGTDICVATPGRLNELLSEGLISLTRCSYIVLDEADRLLDMGFLPQIKSIFHFSRPERQVLMWSATWPKEVQSLANTFLNDYILIKFGSAQLRANPNINQIIHMCEEREKLDLLKQLLTEINKSDDNKTIIFVKTKLKADRIHMFLKSEGYKVGLIHGDKSQYERDKSLNLFRGGRIKFIVGTLVIGRGIDIEDIRYVINYDLPNCIEDYVHIIGRTARKSNSGTSHSFFTYSDYQMAPALVKILEEAKQNINPSLLKLSQRHFRGGGNPKSRAWDII